MQSEGKRVLLHVLEIACVGLRRRVGFFGSDVVWEWIPVSIAAETVEAMISTTARSEKKMIFFFEEDLGLVMFVGSEGVEPPGSDSPNLPYSIVKC